MTVHKGVTGPFLGSRLACEVKRRLAVWDAYRDMGYNNSNITITIQWQLTAEARRGKGNGNRRNDDAS